MAKSRSQWICSECQATQSGWFGKCPSCAAWNTIEEVTEAAEASPGRVVLSSGTTAAAVALSDVGDEQPRITTGMLEVDRVLGGGFIPGSVVLLGGAPGIGKSTLLLQVAARLAGGKRSVLYASGEESLQQIAGRARRLGADGKRLLLLAETRTETILSTARELSLAGELELLVVDSVQTVYSSENDGLPGNTGQVRAVSTQLISFAKQHDVPVVIVGHITKDGQLAGPRLLEHMVDTVLNFEGDDDRATRLLRASKNRFGSTLELGVFEMTAEGLREIHNPSEAFLAQRPIDAPGSCITVSMQGARPLLLEVQALLANSPGGSPRRNSVGVDPSRLAMMLAVLDRHGGQFVLDQDVFVNVTGGVRLFEPAADLAVMLAIASSHRRIAMPTDMVAVGEIGLTGELRHAARIENRLVEAARLGFKRALIAPSSSGKPPKAPKGLKVRAPKTVQEALGLALEG
ncbi:MAG: DNA repair protein RadA [Nannocystaceae bacterium]|nr:DNA repair protein RadA [Nannocystaceae bacterium]